MIVVIHGDDDAKVAGRFRHGSVFASVLICIWWLRQNLYINLAGEETGEQQVAGAAEIWDLLAKCGYF